MGTIGKTLGLLDHFSAERPSIGLSEFQRLTGYSKATVHRHLAALAEAGFVEKDFRSHAYRLGPALTRLAAARECCFTVREIVKPHVDAISRGVAELAHATVIDGDRLRSVYYAQHHDHAVRVQFSDDEIIPFHATSSGISVLAWLDEDQVEELLEKPLEAMTERTETRAEVIRQKLRAVRRAGYAEMNQTREAGVCSASIPFFDGVERPLGALSITFPVTRDSAASRRRFICALMGQGQRITEALGGRPPARLLRIWQNAGEADQDGTSRRNA